MLRQVIYFELPHSGHGLQNDDKISMQWVNAVEEYLDIYLPVKQGEMESG